jgi:hypothetical protein
MLKVIRNAESKVVVFISYGEVSLSDAGVTDDSIELEPGSWPANEGWELLSVEVEAPSDYLGNKYKLIEDGESYRWDLA